MIKTIGVAGLGLIGGSIAKAIHQYTDCVLLGCDTDGQVLSRALGEGVLSAALTPDRLAECDLVIAALYPEATVAYVTRNRSRFRKGGIVMDCGGVKGVVCGPLEQVAREEGFHFCGVGGAASSAAIPWRVSNAPATPTPFQGCSRGRP